MFVPMFNLILILYFSSQKAIQQRAAQKTVETQQHEENGSRSQESKRLAHTVRGRHFTGQYRHYEHSRRP